MMSHLKYTSLLFLAVLVAFSVIGGLDHPKISEALSEPCEALNRAALLFTLFLVFSTVAVFAFMKSIGDSKAYIVYSVAYVPITAFFAWSVFEDGRYSPSSLYFLTHTCIQ